MFKHQAYDIIIVGAGPAGSSAAYFLKDHFDKVLLIDKSSIGFEKLCGGAVAQDALDHLEKFWNIEDGPGTKYLGQMFQGGQIYFKDKLIRDIDKTDLKINMTMRADFDNELARMAQEKGVELRYNSKLTEAVWDGENHDVRINGEILSTKYIVAADGTPSFVGKKYGLERDQSEFSKFNAMGYEFHFPRSEEIPEELFAKPKLVFGVLPGYLWIFPKENYLSVGIGGFGDSKFLKSELERFCNKYNLPWNRSDLKGHWLPFHRPKSVLSKNGVFLVGDAAGLVDPVAGKGISYALESGRILAEAISGSFERNSAEFRYNELMKPMIRDINYGMKIRWFLYHRPWAQLGMRAIRKIDWVAEDAMSLICGKMKFEELWWKIWKKSPILLFKTIF